MKYLTINVLILISSQKTQNYQLGQKQKQKIQQCSCKVWVRPIETCTA